METHLKFKDHMMEKDYIATRQNFHRFSFRNLILSLVLQSSGIYFTNPLELNILEAKILIPFVVAMLGTITFFLIISKKLDKFCSLALLICVVLFILGASEFVNYLQKETILEPWAHFLLGINIQTGCLFLLVSRVRWTHSLMVLSFSHIYSWIRIIDIFKSSGAQKTAIISLLIHVFLLFSINYSSEKGDRESFEKLQLQNSQLKAYEELIKKVIPSAIIIVKEEKICFLNEFAQNILGVIEPKEGIDVLQRIKIVNKRPDINLSSPTKIQVEATFNNFGNNLFELTKQYENAITCGNFDLARGFTCAEGELAHAESAFEKTFSCQVGPFLWQNSMSVVIILSDISPIKNYYKTLDIYKDNLLATVSHDLRTPLNGMLGMLELLVEDTHEVSQREKLHITMSSAKLLLSMINDILDFSLISKGKLRLKFESTNVTALVEETGKILDLQARLKGLELQIENMIIDKEENHIIDGNRIRQVLLNLMGNAIKFTKFGKITIRIKEEVIDEFDYISNEDIIMNQHKNFLVDEIQENNYSFSDLCHKKCLVFEVEDTGIGIKPEDLGKLFKLFSRVDEENGLNKSGIGLGLAISQSLVQMMNSNRKGGQITVESEYGKGSKFSFPIYVEKEPSTFFKEILGFESRLPQSIEVKTFNLFNFKDLSPTSNMMSEGDSLLIETKKQIRVLVVDDDPINLLVAKSYLRSPNDEYLLSTANNGKEAIDNILDSTKRNFYYDVILMDCNMPIMDGYEATQKLKAMINSRILPQVPIIAITANVGNSDKEHCFKSGMDFFLTKPYSKQQLLATMKDALRHHQS